MTGYLISECCHLFEVVRRAHASTLLKELLQHPQLQNHGGEQSGQVGYHRVSAHGVFSVVRVDFNLSADQYFVHARGYGICSWLLRDHQSICCARIRRELRTNIV